MLRIQTLALLTAALGHCASLYAQQADTVLIHGTILTVDAEDSVAQALAIRGGGIIAVGSDAQIMKLAGKTTRIIDLHGRTATPGMIDTHSHYAEAGAEDLYLIKLDDATSIADVVARVKARVAVAKPGEWVSGRGWDQGKLAERRYVYASDLDAVSPNNPVLLTHTSGHYATVNSYALKLAGIDDATRSPANGTIDRDAAGHITGVLKEGAIAPIRALLPQFTKDQIKQGILKEIDDLHREGVTAFKDTAKPAQWSALHELNEAGKLDERVCMLWRAGGSIASAQTTLAAIQAASATPRAYQQGRLAACGAKIFMDGAAMAGTAWSYQPWFKAIKKKSKVATSLVLASLRGCRTSVQPARSPSPGRLKSAYGTLFVQLGSCIQMQTHHALQLNLCHRSPFSDFRCVRRIKANQIDEIDHGIECIAQLV